LVNGNDVFIAPSAVVAGDVFVGEGTGVWYGAVVRGDNSRVFIGAKCGIGDKVVINTVPSRSVGEGVGGGGGGGEVGVTSAIPLPSVVRIGNYVTIGSGTVIAGDLETGDGVVIGEGCVVGEGCVLEDGCSVEPGTVLPGGTRVPRGEVWGGGKGGVEMTGTGRQEGNERRGREGEVVRDDHIKEFLPFGNAHVHLEELEGRRGD